MQNPHRMAWNRTHNPLAVRRQVMGGFCLHWHKQAVCHVSGRLCFSTHAPTWQRSDTRSNSGGPEVSVWKMSIGLTCYDENLKRCKCSVVNEEQLSNTALQDTPVLRLSHFNLVRVNLLHVLQLFFHCIFLNDRSWVSAFRCNKTKFNLGLKVNRDKQTKN